MTVARVDADVDEDLRDVFSKRHRAADAEAGADIAAEFAASLAVAPIALVPEKANEQHYEVPAAFFGEVLGRHRKYSSCWFPEGVTTLDAAEAAALEATGDAAFGLVAGKSLALMRYGAITPLVLPTPSLRQLLADLQRFACLSVEHSEIELQETARSARLRILPVVSQGHSGHFRMEQVATSAAQMLKFVGASSADIRQVDFPYSVPEEQRRRYEATFGPRIVFGSKDCGIDFNPALLDAGMPTHDPVAYVAARTRAEAALAAMRAGTDVAERVRQSLLQALPAQPTVAETAARMGMPERTLRRHLAMLGTSHAALMQACQQLVAERLLAEGRMPLKQIADALGFLSVHSFHRAFRRWSGVTPSAWRAQALR